MKNLILHRPKCWKDIKQSVPIESAGAGVEANLQGINEGVFEMVTFGVETKLNTSLPQLEAYSLEIHKEPSEIFVLFCF